MKSTRSIVTMSGCVLSLLLVISLVGCGGGSGRVAAPSGDDLLKETAAKLREVLPADGKGVPKEGEFNVAMESVEAYVSAGKTKELETIYEKSKVIQAALDSKNSTKAKEASADLLKYLDEVSPAG